MPWIVIARINRGEGSRGFMKSNRASGYKVDLEESRLRLSRLSLRRRRVVDRVRGDALLQQYAGVLDVLGLTLKYMLWYHTSMCEHQGRYIVRRSSR